MEKGVVVMATVAVNQWTGTRGTVLRELLTWDEERQRSAQACAVSPEIDCTPVIVARAWEWFRTNFPEDAKIGEVSVRLVVELWLDD